LFEPAAGIARIEEEKLIKSPLKIKPSKKVQETKTPMQ